MDPMPRAHTRMHAWEVCSVGGGEEGGQRLLRGQRLLIELLTVRFLGLEGEEGGRREEGGERREEAVVVVWWVWSL